jgi:serine/threonine-protein phosphatase 5
MMEWQKKQKNIHRKYATMIVLRATELFEKDDNCVHITIEDLEEITVCGDVHG